ncbi:MAG: KH domain-containing protein [Clostridia bacterium]|nr:KH domain-containing protein [Clostridia bacterium]
MKQEFIVTAKTVIEAYNKAQEMYSSLGEISYEVIKEGKKGFLGFGRVLAEIKVICDDGKEEKQVNKAKIQIQGGTKKENTPKENKPKPQGGEKKHSSNHKGKGGDNKTKGGDKPTANNTPKTETKVEGPKSNKKVDAPKTTVNGEPRLTRDEKEEAINVTVEEKTLALNFLKSFVKDIGFDCEVKGDLTVNENGFVSRLITIEGKDAPSLIGHRGDMLDAIQYLANLCLARKSEGEHKEYVKVIIDIENYREKREQSLRNLARRMAEKALKYQRNVLLEPMNPYERMIIHSEVQTIEGVSTHSVGYDENRKIVITCDNKKKNNRNNKKA